MARNRPPASLGGTPDDVEVLFYDALRKGDLEAVMALWADDDEIVCVHPGGSRAVGPTAVRASFAALFAHGTVTAHPEQVRRMTWLGGALHHLFERIAVPPAQAGGDPRPAWVFTINVYVKTAQGWRIASHHASPGTLDEPPDDAAGPATLH